MEEAPSPQLVSEFAAITGASPLVAEHYLSACNNDLNRAVEFFFEHPPAPTQAGPGRRDADDEAMAGGGDGGMGNEVFGRGPAAGPAMDEDEELQRALAASMTDAEPGAAPSGRRGPSRPGPAPRRPQYEAEVIDGDDVEAVGGELEGADGMLAEMARMREAAMRAEREAEDYMEETFARSGLLGAQQPGRPPGTVNPPPGYPGALGVGVGVPPIMFPGLGPGLGVGGGVPPGLFPPGMLQPGFPSGASGPSARGRSGSDSSGPGGGGSAAQRRRVVVSRGGGAGGEGPSGGAGSGGGDGGGGPAPPPEGRGEDAWADDHEALGMSRAELEEARMMEAAMLGIPYEGPLPRAGGGGPGGLGGRRGGSEEREVAPEVLEHRELRWDQDRAYEESLAADRAKEQAAARARAEAEARERAQRQAEEEAAMAAAMEASRIAALLAQKAARLPAEPPASASDAINVMVRLPDGTRHSRRFAPSDRLGAVFDFVDVQLDGAAKAAAAAGAAGGGADQEQQQPQQQQSQALKPGSYRLVTQFPRRAFSEADSGAQSFAEAGLAGGGGAAFFVEQTAG